MTNTKQNDEPRSLSIKVNRFLYGAFVALGFYFLLVTKDISTAMSNFGIALIFDPFDPKLAWNDRPRYQKVWLLVHVSIVFGLLGIMLLKWLTAL